MLETIREYALERLAASGETDVIRRQHARYFLAFAEVAEPLLYGAEQKTWLDRLAADHDNLRAALAWCQAVDESALGLRLGVALGRFWYVRGLFGEGRRWLERGLAQGNSVPAILCAKAFSWAGSFAAGQSDRGAAHAMSKSSIALFREAGDIEGLADALSGLAWMAFDESDYPLARASAEEGVSLWLAMALGAYGYITDGLGDTTAARASAEESLTLFRSTGDRWNLAGPLSILGNLARREGNHVAARAKYEEALALWRETGDKVGIAWGLRNLGALAQAQGDQAWAMALFTESLVIEREKNPGHKPYIALCLEGLAWVAGELGQRKRAVRLFGAAQALRETSGALIPPADRGDHDSWRDGLKGVR
jgi:tetratricopeptide (TPR) repeat protein